MYCSTCGSSIPAGQRECGTCGSVAALPPSSSAQPSGAGGGAVEGAAATAPFLNLAPITICPRCQYQGQGLPYFSRGPHVAGLVAATLFTLPYALGAGGVVYYGLRHDHRVCPRCGFGWGKRGAGVLPTSAPWRGHSSHGGSDVPIQRGNEGVLQVWSVILLAFSAILMLLGVLEGLPAMFVFALAAGGGGFLCRRAASRSRARRREALLAALQMRVLKLAGERRGRLTVTDVAASLGWPIRRAEKVLNSLDDGWRVNSEVTDEGVIVYEFRELLLGRSD
jgi:hypothetical protein